MTNRTKRRIAYALFASFVSVNPTGDPDAGNPAEILWAFLVLWGVVWVVCWFVRTVDWNRKNAVAPYYVPPIVEPVEEKASKYEAWREANRARNSHVGYVAPPAHLPYVAPVVVAPVAFVPSPRPVPTRKPTTATCQEVWKRDGGRCQDCGSTENLHFDHMIPYSRGGGNGPGNIQLLCQTCNLSKGNRRIG